jgi:RND family efflux transporter MFP subunit
MLIACTPEAVPEVEDVPRPVKTFEVGSNLVGISREWPGRVEPTQNAEMSFNIAGTITQLSVSEGMPVSKGQILAKLDARQLRARLDSERAQERFQEVEYQRSAILVEKGAVAPAELDRRVQGLAVAKAAVAEARKALDDATMKAPFAGTIAKVLVNNFQTVQAKEKVLVLQDASSLEIVTHVSQRDYAAARPGLTISERNERVAGRVHVVIETLPDLPIEAELKEIATVPDPITGTYEVTWSFTPPEATNITPGMTAKVVLDPEVIDAQAGAPVFVPIEAVVGSDTGGAHVWVIDRETMIVTSVPVTTGGLSNGSIEILSGLVGGELLATTGVHVLRDGVVVTRFDDIYGDVQRAR